MRIPKRTEQFPLFLTTAMFFAMAGCWPVGAWDRCSGSGARSGRQPSSSSVSGRRFWEQGRGRNSLADQLERPGRPDQGGSREYHRGGCTGQAVQLVAQGRAAYAAGRLAEALWPSSRPPRLLLPTRCRGTTRPLRCFSSSGIRKPSITIWKRSQRAGAALRTKIDYALGNTALVLGEIPVAVAHYDRCMASRATGPDLDSVRSDAAINRRFALEQAPLRRARR